MLELNECEKSIMLFSKVPLIVLSWKADGTILTNQTDLTKELLNNGKSLEGLNIDKVLSNGEGVFEQINDVAFSGQMDFEDIIALAPEKIKIQDRHFELSYQAELSDGNLETITVFGKDITKLQRLISATEKNIWFNKMCLEIIKERKIFNTYFKESVKGLTEAVEIIDSEELKTEHIEQLFRIVHSIKGSGSSFYLKPLIKIAHELEHELDEHRKKGVIEDRIHIRTELLKIEEILVGINTKIVKLAGEYSEKIKTIDDDEIKRILHSLDKEDSDSIKDILSDLSKQHLKCYLENKIQSVFSSTMQHLSNKNINLCLNIQSIRVDSKIIEALDMSLPHLIRNSMDHGIETVPERKAAKKSFHGTLSLKVYKEDDHCKIILSDDGKGINPDIVSKIAFDKGIISEAQLNEMSIEDKQALIFAPGFSTAEEVSEISGRGVGMDSVKMKIESINATLDLESTVGKGTEFVITIPLND